MKVVVVVVVVEEGDTSSCEGGGGGGGEEGGDVCNNGVCDGVVTWDVAWDDILDLLFISWISS